MLKVFKCCCFVFIVLQFLGCNSSIKNEAAFLEWLNQPENGYVKKNHTNGFSMTMKYLPAEYLAYAEFKNEDLDPSKDRATLVEEFEDSRTFILSIEHEVSGIDISNYGIQNISEFKRRISELNFNIKDYIFLKNENGKKSKPVLTTFENSYELGGKKTFYIVFAKEQEKDIDAKKIDIVFEDPFFDTGINHFMFQTEQIDHSPILQFIN